MKKIVSLILLFVVLITVSGINVTPVNASPVKTELFGKKKKFKGYQKPKSKKILGIFKRKTDCGCPKH